MGVVIDSLAVSARIWMFPTADVARTQASKAPIVDAPPVVSATSTSHPRPVRRSDRARPRTIWRSSPAAASASASGSAE